MEKVIWPVLWLKKLVATASRRCTRALPNCSGTWPWHAPTAVCRARLLRLARIDVLIVDDWVMAPLSDVERRDFLEICDDRYQRRSTILTSQLPVAKWHPQIGDPTLADSILDRLVHNASPHRAAGRIDAQEAGPQGRRE